MLAEPKAAREVPPSPPTSDGLPAQVELTRQLGYISHTERTLSNAARAFMNLLDAQRDDLAQVSAKQLT